MSQSLSPLRWRPFASLGGVTVAGLGRDLTAGLTLAAVGIPEQMATARLGGFSPELGLAAFVAAALGFAAFGASRRLSVGADSTITPIFAGGLAALAIGPAHYGAAAQTLALLVGAILLAAGLLRMGWVADLVSTPVISGFLAGIAVHIVISQAPSVLGLPPPSGPLLQQVRTLWAERGAARPAAAAVGLGVLGVTWVLDKISPRIPGALLALATATAATAALHLERHGVPVLGPLAGGLPRPHAPSLALAGHPSLWGLALVIATVIMVQTGATTRAFSDADDAIDRDFVGVGWANLLSALAGSFPVNASPPRTAIVAETGGGSQWAALAAAGAVLLFATLGASLVAHTPSAALAGVLLFVAQRIVRLRTFAVLARRTGAEFALALATAVLIVVLPIEEGVAAGVFLSLVHGVFTITRARTVVFEPAPGSTVWWPAKGAATPAARDGVLVMGFQAPLSYLNAYDFRAGVRAATAVAGAGGELKLFVLEASGIVEIDFTAATVLGEVITATRAGGVDFAVARLESLRAQAAFERYGLSAQLGRDHLFHSVAEAVAALAPTPPTAPARPRSRR